MGIFAAIIMGLFMYVGSSYLMTNVIVGTASTDISVQVVKTILPVVLALGVVGVTIMVFRG